MPNFFNIALRNLSGALSRGPDTSVARVYGFSNHKKAMDRMMTESLERSFGFEGAWYDRTNSNWVAWRSSLDAILRTSIWILIGRCRDLQRTNSIVQRALNLWKNNVVGPQGIRLRSNVRDDNGKPLMEINRPINEHWHYFGFEENLTPAGDMDMVEFQKHLISLTPVDGTCFIKTYLDPALPYGIGFRILEVDLLDLNKFENGTGTDVEIKFGIEKQRSTGKTLGYWMYLENPNDLSLASSYSAGKSFRVPAEEIDIVMKRERPMQTIGIPWFVRAMTNLHILHAYTKATLIKSQMAASYFIFILNEFATQEGDMGPAGDVNGFQQLPVDNGIALELKKGQKVENMSPQNYASDLEALFTWTLRMIGGDLDLSYHAFTGDTSKGNYSSLRMATLEERTGHIANQVWLSTILRRMFRKWLRVQLLSRRHFTIKDSLYQKIVYCAQWIGRRWDWVDPKNEAAAEISLINAALKSRTKYWQERGHNPEDEVAELNYEQVMLEDAEIVIQTESGQQLHFGQTDATVETAPGKKPAGKPAPDDDADGEGEGE